MFLTPNHQHGNIEGIGTTQILKQSNMREGDEQEK